MNNVASLTDIRDCTFLIPAYKPSSALITVVDELAAGGAKQIVVIDDGSGTEYGEVFARVGQSTAVTVLRHATNLGKGAALKTGLNHAACRYPSSSGVVTADADGQHLPGDILRVADELTQHPGCLVLGARQFSGTVPLRSRVGNLATRYLMRLLEGIALTDTQTGLRGIPTSMIPKLLRVDSRGYEFELDMLLTASRARMPIREVPIETVYIDGNASSHFNPLLDSMRIYFVLLRFAIASLLTAAVDYTVFALVYSRVPNVLVAQGAGRLVAVMFNYAAVKKAVFYSDQKHSEVLLRYLALVVVSGLVSYGLIQFLLGHLTSNVIQAKLMAESLVFIANFAIARQFVFTQHGAEKPDIA